MILNCISGAAPARQTNIRRFSHSFLQCKSTVHGPPAHYLFRCILCIHCRFDKSMRADIFPWFVCSLHSIRYGKASIFFLRVICMRHGDHRFSLDAFLPPPARYFSGETNLRVWHRTHVRDYQHTYEHVRVFLFFFFGSSGFDILHTIFHIDPAI